MKAPSDSGGAFFTENQGQIWSGDNDLDIWQTDNTFLSAIASGTSEGGNLEAGDRQIVQNWLDADDQGDPIDSPLPFDSLPDTDIIPVEDENLTDEQRTIEWATSLGGGADNL